jgi:outer membrane protein OmpU
MKKLLMATTALAGAALVAGGASAQTTSASEPIKLTLGGYFQFYGAAGFQKVGPGTAGADRHNFDIFRESEIHFKGETRLDNGLIIGVQVELEGESSVDQIDESYIWFQGDWGRVLLGSTNPAAYKLAVGYPTVDSNIDGQQPNYQMWAGSPAGTGLPTGNGQVGDPRLVAAGHPNPIDNWVPNTSGDSEKITYLSPRFAGFRGGISYTPDQTEGDQIGGEPAARGGAGSGFTANNNPKTWNNLVSAAINYENKLGPLDIQAAVGWERGFLEGAAVQGAGLTGVTLKDRDAYQAGIDVGFAGFHVGGGYFVDDNGIDATATGADASGRQNTYGVGATYSLGPLTVGSTWLHSRRNREPVGQSEKFDRILIGARYALGPGVDIRSSATYFDYKGALSDTATVLGTSPGANNDNGWIFVLGTVLTF